MIRSKAARSYCEVYLVLVDAAPGAHGDGLPPGEVAVCGLPGGLGYTLAAGECGQLGGLRGAEHDLCGRRRQESCPFVLVTERHCGLSGQHHAGPGAPATLEQVDRGPSSALDGRELVHDQQRGGAGVLAGHGEVPDVADEHAQAGGEPRTPAPAR
jgi:hypothetical protein